MSGGPPLFVLGVRRSGTTLLRVMLDRSSLLAVPDESYVIPQLAARHRGPIDAQAFSDDLRRLGRLPELGIDVERVAERLRPGMPAGAAISALFATYAAEHGKLRWGDKTPLYMQHLPLLERLFPDAQFVHLVRDGRDAALSYLAVPAGLMTESWGHPRTVAGFACQWAVEVEAADRLSARVGSLRFLEMRYEELVADPRATLRRICDFAGLPFEDELLGYVGTVDLAGKPHQARLSLPPTPGVRDWRTEMSPSDAARFSAIAGDVLRRHGYEASAATAAGAARRAHYRLQGAAWRTTAALLQRTPLWRRRHPLLQSTPPG